MTKLPTLGPRGEGWVALQMILLASVALAGTLGPAWDGATRIGSVIAGVALIATGGTMGILGLRDLGANLTPLPYPRDEARLVETGIYARVRHPIYGGLVLGGAGWGLATASPIALVLALILLAFFNLKARREEAWLTIRFPDYPAYRLRTRAFIPFLI
ncbi:MAG: isoprenylcysteine carboxylmethyltransferase family protein [Chloroflexota bacterium]